VAYDEALAERIRAVVAGLDAGRVEEKRMFGGLGFLVNGNMAVAAQGSTRGLMVRVDPEQTDRLAAEPGACVMQMRGRAMRGWITVEADALTKAADLRRWVKRGVDYSTSLPPK
jgi:TfoX/Sxy family transcriptional regulator of competence genes